MGRPTHKPTKNNRDTVKLYSGMGIPVVDIALKLKIDKETLYKYYSDELAEGRNEANLQVMGALFRSATVEKNVPAQIFWAKSRVGLKETSGLEVSGPNGGPLSVEVSEAKSKLYQGLEDDDE